MSIVITHPEHGIYVGTAMGLGFWSNLDAAGQDCAVVFEDAADARDFVSTWEENNDPAEYGYAEVEVSAEARFATVDELREAGLGELIGELQVTVPGFGHA